MTGESREVTTTELTGAPLDNLVTPHKCACYERGFGHQIDEVILPMQRLYVVRVLVALTSVFMCGPIWAIRMSESSGGLILNEGVAEIVEVPTLLLEDPVYASPIVGRRLRYLSHKELSLAQVGAPSGISRPVHTRTAGFFDLWELFGDAQKSDYGKAVRLVFTIEDISASSVVVSFGTNDCVIAFADGEPIWGIVGSREHNEGENALTIPVNQGKLKLELLCWKAKCWKAPPAEHFADEWSVNIRVFSKERDAWSDFLKREFHFLDTPIVNSFFDFRVRYRLSSFCNVKVYDMTGRVLSTGTVNVDGTINLDPSSAALPQSFVGLIELAGELTESIVVDSSERFDYIGRRASALDEIEHDDPQAIRLRYLLAERPQSTKDEWWARKLVLSLAQCEARVAGNQFLPSFKNWRASWFQFSRYLSQIDGTAQYLLSFSPPRAAGDERPLAIILPGVPQPVRPFLESRGIADLKELEILAANASGMEVNLLWPGIVDVDYGGLLTQYWLLESLAAYDKSVETRSSQNTFLVGSCSAGVAAINLAKLHNLCGGVVLWTPMVMRRWYKWPGREDSRTEPYLGRVMWDESVANNFGALNGLNVFMLFDQNEIGHGDRDGARRACEQFRGVGANLHEEWIADPDNRMLWGMRASASEKLWLSWIRECSTSDAGQPAGDVARPPNNHTIKSSLLDGFEIPDSQDLRSELAVSKLRSTLQFYRGRMPIPKESDASRKQLVVHTLKSLEIVRRFWEEKPIADRQLNLLRSLPSTLARYEKFVACEVSESDSGPVTVYIDQNVNDSDFPEIDLLLDGVGRSVLWGLREGKWEMAELWY